MRKYDTEIEFKRRCYELYQLDWMRTHGYSLQDAFNILREGYAEGCASENIFDAIKEYFEEQGFDGEIFVCENEFYDCEYQDVGYMEYLLPKDMLIQYRSYTISNH